MNKTVLMLLNNEFIADNRVEREISALINNGYTIELICWDREKKQLQNEIREGRKLIITRIGPHAKRGKGSLYLLYKYLLLNLGLIKVSLHKKFDIIHCHNIATILAGRIIKLIRKKPLIYDAHEVLGLLNQRLFNGADKIIHNVERILAKIADIVFVPTPGVISLFKQRGYKNNIICIENFPTKEYFKDITRIRVSKDKIVVGYIGTIGELKNINIIIDIIDNFNKEGKKIKLLIAGPISSNYDNEFFNLLKDKEYICEYLGVIPAKEVQNIYQKIDISINIPGPVVGYIYGYPSKLFEAMAAGIPTIHSDIGETKSLIDEIDCGVIIEDYSIESIIKAFIILLEDKEKRKQMSLNGRQAFLNKYNWEKVSEKLIDNYHNLNLYES